MSQPTPSGPHSPTDESVDVLVVGAAAGGLPRTTMTKFLPKVLANLGETPRGRVGDRLMAALAKIAPAA